MKIRKLFEKFVDVYSKGNYSARHADLQEDGTVFLYWKANKSIKIAPASFSILELEEIVRQAKKIHNM